MRRRRYLRVAGAAGVTGVAGCSGLPFGPGADSPLRGSHERDRPVVSLAAGPDGVYAADVPDGGETLLVGLSLGSVKTRWERRLLTNGSDLAMWRVGDRLMAMNGDTVIVTEAGFSKETWRRSGATVPVVADGTAFLRSVRAVTYIEGLDLDSGGIEWSIEIDGRPGVPPTRAPRAIAGDRIVISDTRRPLRTRARSDGSSLWETETNFEIPVAGTPEGIYAIERLTADQAVLHRLQPADGSSTHTYDVAAERLNVEVSRETVVVFSKGTEPGVIMGLDPETLAERWRVEGVHTRTDWIGPETILAVDSEEEVVELDPGTGDRRWSSTLDQETVPALAWTDAVVAIATPDSIECRDRQDGEQRWQFSVPEPDSDAPPVSLTTTPGVIGHAVGQTVRVFGTEG